MPSGFGVKNDSKRCSKGIHIKKQELSQNTDSQEITHIESYKKARIYRKDAVYPGLIIRYYFRENLF